VRGGRRIINSVSARSILTLDIDVCTEEFIEDVQLLYGEAMCITSTHKHSTLTPRYRLVMPLDRDVMGDEYEHALARSDVDAEILTDRRAEGLERERDPVLAEVARHRRLALLVGSALE